MKEKTFIQQLKDWWNDNKKVIKVGFTFGVLGVAYGFIKGAAVTDNMWLEHGFERALNESDTTSDKLEMADEDHDNPELLEVVKSEEDS